MKKLLFSLSILFVGFAASAQCVADVAPYTESFDVTGLPSCWSSYINSGSAWAFSTGSGPNTACGTASEHTGNSGYFAWMDQSGTDDSVCLEMNDIDVSALTTPYLEFYFSECGSNVTLPNFLHVEAWDGTVWTNVGSINQATAGWTYFGFDLTTHTYGASLVRIRFRAESGGDSFDYNADPLLDDISVVEAPTCQQPGALNVTAITASSADLGWTANGGETAWDIEWGVAGFTPGAGTTVANTASNPYALTGLTAVTSYDFYVRGICGAGDTSAWAGPFNFSTPCGNFTPNYIEDFSTYTSSVLPTCWEEAQGVLGAVNTTFTATTSSWGQDGFGNVGTTGSAKMEIWSTGRDEWLISPSIDLGTGATPYQLQFDVALTSWSTTAADVFGSDDTLAIVISTDNGVTWANTNILQLYTAGSEPSATGDFTVVPLTGYTGVVKFGLYAASSVSGGDINVYIDNFEVRTVPNCPQPVGVVVDSLDPTVAYISWTLGAADAVLEYGPSGFTQGSGTTVSVTGGTAVISGLTGATGYEFYIKDSCNTVDTSPWTGPVSFTTDCPVYMPAYSQDFSTLTSSVQPACWEEFQGVLGSAGTTVTNATTSNWTVDGFANVTTTGAAKINLYSTGRDEWFVSPSIDLGTGLTAYEVSFDIALNDYANTNSGILGVDDTIAIVISTDNGVSWTQANILQQWVAGSEPSNTGEFVAIDLSAYTGVVKFGFYAASSTSNEDNDITIDNFLVDVIPTCPKPLNLSSSNVMSTSVDIAWTSTGAASQIEYGVAGFTPGTGTIVSATTNPFNVTGLSDQTTYEYYVRDVCGAGDTSLWNGPGSFTTPCLAFTAPIIDDVETHTPTTNLGDSQCWSTSSVSAFDWNIDGSGSTPSSGTGPLGANSGSNYFYVEASSGSLGDYADLFSPSVDVSALTDPSMTFAYHMFGGDIDTLEVSINDGSGWTEVFQLFGAQQAAQGDAFITQRVQLDGYTGIVQARFRAYKGSSYEGDISLDDLGFVDCPTTYSTLTLVECDSFVSASGMVHFTSAMFNDTILNSVGCDSVISYDLTINASSTGTDVQVACETYTWIDGMMYTASNNSATFVLTNAAGCDSTVTLDLTINNAATGTDIQVACDSYTWMNGLTYTASNNSATHVIAGGAANGCDSIITLDLTINNSNTGIAAVSACDSYTWIDGVTYSVSTNAPTHTLTNAAGCDSIVTLYLTINSASVGTASITACGSYTWINGMTYTASGNSATYVLNNSNGCDSTVTLDLTIIMPATNTITATECETYTSAAGNTYTSTGMYTETLTGANGCDSILTIDLTITNANYTVSVSSGIHLTSNQPGATYQWLDCSNGNAPIAGATNQVYIATVNGDYACEVTYQSCSGTSTCVTVNTVGIDDASATFANVYPNPVNDLLTITLSDLDNAQFELIDMQGKVVISSTTITSGQKVDVSNLESGVYFVRLVSDENSMIKRVVKN